MGNDESAANDESSGFQVSAPGYYYDEYSSESSSNPALNTKYSRIDGTNIQDFMNDNPLEDEDGGTMIRASIAKMPYNGIWSIRHPEGKAPHPRTAHFTAYSDELRTIFVGYGKRKNGQLLNDVWAFDVDDMKWTKLKLKGDKIQPRCGAVATMMGNYIVVFGGTDGNICFAQLHTIDVTSGEVLIADTRGVQPAPRFNPVIAIYRKRLYIWGGADGNSVNQLNVLDFATMKWGIVSTDVPSRPNGAWAVHKQRIFVYGGSTSKDFVVVDMKNNSVVEVPSQGAQPKPGVVFPGMVKVGNYLLFFGGKANSRFNLVYACELSTLWWFVFFVAPDGETTSLSDGKLSTDGLFELPRTDSFSTVYDPVKREVLAFLGHPHKIAVPIFVLSIGQALSFLNLREDMMAMLEMELESANE